MLFQPWSAQSAFLTPTNCDQTTSRISIHSSLGGDLSNSVSNLSTYWTNAWSQSLLVKLISSTMVRSFQEMSFHFEKCVTIALIRHILLLHKTVAHSKQYRRIELVQESFVLFIMNIVYCQGDRRRPTSKCCNYQLLPTNSVNKLTRSIRRKRSTSAYSVPGTSEEEKTPARVTAGVLWCSPLYVYEIEL